MCLAAGTLPLFAKTGKQGGSGGRASGGRSSGLTSHCAALPVGTVEIAFTLMFRCRYLKDTLRPSDTAGPRLMVGAVLPTALGR